MKRLLSLALTLISVISVALAAAGCQGRKGSDYSETRFLLDTVCTVRTGGPQAKAAAEAAFQKIQEVQDAADCYRETSTVAAFNRAPAGTPVPLDDHTLAIVEVALEISQASGGAFDPTIAPVQKLWPFHGEENPAPPPEAELAQRLPLVDYTGLTLDRAAKTLTKDREGMELDLGAAAKGYAADLALAAIQAAGADYGLLDLGGNVGVVGPNPDRKDGSWTVGLQEPFAEPGTYRQTVTLTQGAVVTSGVYQRCFTYAGRLYHHILNPRTGYPADTGLSAVSIQAESGLLADCLSTACLALGEEAGRALAQRYGAEAVFFPATETEINNHT